MVGINFRNTASRSLWESFFSKHRFISCYLSSKKTFVQTKTAYNSRTVNKFWTKLKCTLKLKYTRKKLLWNKIVTLHEFEWIFVETELLENSAKGKKSLLYEGLRWSKKNLSNEKNLKIYDLNNFRKWLLQPFRLKSALSNFFWYERDEFWV